MLANNIKIRSQSERKIKANLKKSSWGESFEKNVEAFNRKKIIRLGIEKIIKLALPGIQKNKKISFIIKLKI